MAIENAEQSGSGPDVDGDDDGESESGVSVGAYSWEDYLREHGKDRVADELYGGGGAPTERDWESASFDRGEALGLDVGDEGFESFLGRAGAGAETLGDFVDERTVDVNEEIDEDEFFSNQAGETTIVNRYDMEKSVPEHKKTHFREVERYWVNKPYAFVIIFHSTKENEKKYYVIEPYTTEIEEDLQEFLTGKLRTSIKYADEGANAGNEDHRREVIIDEMYKLLERYDLYDPDASDRGGLGNALANRLGMDGDGLGGTFLRLLGYEEGPPPAAIEGIRARPEPAILEEDEETINEYQVEKLKYYLLRNFIGFERIDGIKHDINVEEISCDGYNTPVFVYHDEYEHTISNIYHGEEELDDFVVKLAQRAGKGISKRNPQVDATLQDGSRSQLTLGREVSSKGTNYTIRQTMEVPFTPIDQIAWNTFSLDIMAFLWLCIENEMSMIIAGGTATGKTTLLNAVSLFIPSNSKIVSIEDTREVELPQRNWIAGVTRPSFAEGDGGDIDEFDLLEAALRQRPDYIVMGEVRGEEGRDLFQVMSTGHVSYSTFHADSVGEVLKRFTTDPINVSKTMFTALDLVAIQTRTRVGGHKVVRNKGVTEINHYDAENDEINVQDVYQWQAETDKFLQMGDSNTLEKIKFDRGWNQQTLDEEIFKRRTVLAYLLVNGLNTYPQVAATFQAFINDPETILSLMATDKLEQSLNDLREMESVLIDIDPEKEEQVPRPEPDEETLEECRGILEEAEERLFEEYRTEEPGDVAEALTDVDVAAEIDADPDELPVDGDDGADTADAADPADAVGADGARADAESEADVPDDGGSPNPFEMADTGDSSDEASDLAGNGGLAEEDAEDGFGDGLDGDLSTGAPNGDPSGEDDDGAGGAESGGETGDGADAEEGADAGEDADADEDTDAEEEMDGWGFGTVESSEDGGE